MDFEIRDTPDPQRFRAEVRAWLDANVPAGITNSPDPADYSHE